MALLPIGLLAVMQTQSVAKKAQVNAELALLSLTEQAAVHERLAVRQAVGMADALSSMLPQLVADEARCNEMLRKIADGDERFGEIGFVNASGVMTCASEAGAYDFAAVPGVQAALSDPAPRVRIEPDGPLSGTFFLIVSHPVFDDLNRLLGIVGISIPHNQLRSVRITGGDQILDDALEELITFSASGDVLTALGDTAAVNGLLPANLEIEDFPSSRPRALTSQDRMGEPHIYTVAPITSGELYVLGIWDGNATLAKQTEGEILTSLFPVFMWAVSLGVSLLAVHQLVTRHLTRLGRQMALFAAARRMPSGSHDTNPPSEIQRIQRAFLNMTDALIRDEASLENAVREKSVLVKEIHHRVKNNLQLISSIISLQIRDADSDEAKAALRLTQDRVLGMATIHRDLYQTNDTGLVNVGHLVNEVVEKSIESAPQSSTIEVEKEIDDIWLFPDQAVPMSLMASEAVINAIKHMPAPGDTAAARRVSVSFREEDDRTCTFSLTNTVRSAPESRHRGKGMGRRLMRAFATQLDAKVDTHDSGDSYNITVMFRASEFAPAPGTF